MHTMTLKAQSEALVSGLVVGCVVKGGAHEVAMSLCSMNE